MNKQYLILPLAIVLVVILLSTAQVNLINFSGSATNEGIKHEGVACSQVIRSDGTVEDLGCTHNEFTDEGKIYIAFAMNGSIGATNQLDRLVLGNGSTAEPGTGALTSLPGEITMCGLNQSAVTFVSHSQGTGNITASYLYTSTCTITVNTTGVNCSTCGGLYDFFAGNDFTSDANLSPDDQLNVTWYIWSA